MQLTTRSLSLLTSLHPDLRAVVMKAAETATTPFIVTETSRTTARQKQLFDAGASKTMKSRHIPSCNQCNQACAVDLAAVVAGQIRWDWPLYALLAAQMKEAAQSLNQPIEWGGDWNGGFKDGPHFQLKWSDYP